MHFIHNCQIKITAIYIYIYIYNLKKNETLPRKLVGSLK